MDNTKGGDYDFSGESFDQLLKNIGFLEPKEINSFYLLL
jgi:hypothetical protein